MIRLFIGLDLPESLKRQLSFMTGGVPGARWTEDSNYHLTLCFVGEVDEGVAEDIDEVLSELREPAFTLEPSGVGQFDRNGHTRIIWAGVRHSPPLEHLQGKIRIALERRGLPVENRRFTPHITLARIKGGAGQEQVFRYLADHNLFAAPAFPVDEFKLFESIRGREGPVYLPIRHYALRPTDR